MFWILFAVAVAISAIGFHKFIWFISVGYGFSVAGIGLMLLLLFCDRLTPVTAVMTVLFIVYGVRLGGYLLLRELKSTSYQNTMKTEIKDGSSMGVFPKICIWLTCALLYVCETSPVLFRLQSGTADDFCGWMGMLFMLGGILLESYSDYTKNRFKKQNPKRFCDVGVFRLVRCPNYFGEVLTWTGVFISGISVYQGAWQWIAAAAGWMCIVYIMFGGARRLEIRQNKNYGNDEEYRRYTSTVPILLPFVPLYSVERYKWLVG